VALLSQRYPERFLLLLSSKILETKYMILLT